MSKIIKNINFNSQLFSHKQFGQVIRVSGYASVFNVKDAHGDIVKKGAFRVEVKSGAITKNSQQQVVPKFLWQHDNEQVIGKIENLYEDDYGLWVEAHLYIDTHKGQEAAILVQQQAIDGLSIGIEIKEHNHDQDKTRIISKAELWEVSLVTFPANQYSRLQDKQIDFKQITAALEKTNKILDRLIINQQKLFYGGSNGTYN